MATTNFQPKIPLEVDNGDNFINISNSLENAKQKLRMVILTNKGEKLMNPDFGVGIERYLFENSNKKITYNYDSLGNLSTISAEDYKTAITNEILSQVQKYLTEIEISNVDVVINENILFISIVYKFMGFFQDNLEMNIAA